MASITRILKKRRALTKAKKGKKRKNFLKRHGSTAPNLPLDVPTANELAQSKNKK